MDEDQSYDDPEYASKVEDLRDTLLDNAEEFLDEEQAETLRDVFTRALTTI